MKIDEQRKAKGEVMKINEIYKNKQFYTNPYPSQIKLVEYFMDRDAYKVMDPENPGSHDTLTRKTIQEHFVKP